jgi:protein SCO1/2
MPARARLALMVFATLVLLGATGLVVLHDPGSSRSANGGFEGSRPPSAVPPRDFDLRDQDGKRVSLRQYRGQDVVLTFMYSTCLDTCPITAQQIKGALDDLGRDVPVLAVSVDPANDTPLNARRFLLKQGMTGRMRFLLGSRAELEPIWRAYRIAPQGKGFDHSAFVMLIDRQGRQRVTWPVSQLTPEPLARDLQRLDAAA